MQWGTGPPLESEARILFVKKRIRRARVRPKQAAHLLQLRKNAGLTQAELAQAADVPQTTIATWEWSSSPPRAEVLPRLARALGVRLEDLLVPQVVRTIAERPGPISEVQRAFEEVRSLPRTQQRKIVDMVLAVVDRYKSRSA